jgi:hypothetical protein
VIHSLIGQNERWAQLAALQPPPGAQAAQPGGSAFSNLGTVAPDPTVVNPVSSGSGSALTNDTSFLLFFLNSGSGTATGTSSTGSNAATQTAGAADDTSGTQGATSLAAQLLTDVQSFLSALAGSSASAGNGPSGVGTPPATSSLAQDIDAITSAGGTVAFAPANGSAPSGSDGGNEVGNTGSASAEPSWRNGWDDGRRTDAAWRQQFGLAAYSASDQSGQTTSTASALQAITA